MLSNESRRTSPPQRLALATCIVLAMGSPRATVAQQQQSPQAERVAAEPATKRYWTTTWSFTDVDIAKVAGRLESLGIDIGVEAAGKVTARLSVGIPWNSLRDAKAYRLDGTLSSQRLLIDDLDIRDLQTEVRYRDGVATLTQLKAAMENRRDDRGPPGRIEGEGAVELVPRGDVTAALTIDDLAIQPLVDIVAKFAPGRTDDIQRGGRASGDVTFRAPLQRIREVATYQLSGRLRWNDVQLAGFPPASVDLQDVAADSGRLRIGAFSFESQPGPQTGNRIRLTGKADVPLTTRGEFSLNLEGNDVPLRSALALATAHNTDAAPAIIDGKVDLRIAGVGNLADRPEDSTWQIEGSLASPSLHVLGLDLGVLEHRIRFTPQELKLTPFRDAEQLPESFQLKKARATYELSSDALIIDSLRAQIFGGRVAGHITFPLQDQDNLIAKVTIDNIRPTVRIPVAGSFSAPTSATIAADVDWRVPMRDLMKPPAHQGTATLEVSDIRIGAEPIGQLSGELTVDRQTLSLVADGQLFGGTVDIATSGDLQASNRWSAVPRKLKATRLEIDGVSFGPLLELATGYRLGVTGTLNGTLRMASALPEAEPPNETEATLFAELSDVRYQSKSLARRMTLIGQFKRGEFLLQSLAGDYAGGRLQLSGQGDLWDARGLLHPRANLRARVTGVQANRGLPFAGEFVENLDGRVSGDARIVGDLRSLVVRGNLTGTDLVAYGLHLGTAHSSLLAKVDPGSLAWDARLPDVTARVGRGQLKGEASLQSGLRGGVDLTSRWQAQRLSFFELSQRFGTPTTLARGDISGKLSLEGKSVRSINDLVGRFAFKLSETRGAAIPGLVGASRFLGPLSLATQTFDVGEAKGVISRGVVDMREFWLGSDDAIVRADGKIYLDSSRMDMKVVIATGDYTGVAADFEQLASANLLATVLPASAVLRVSEILRDRTLVVAINGTLQNPIVRPRPVETFQAELARLVLREGRRLILGGFAIGTVDGLDDNW